LARATSDLAGMGAKARFFLLTLALPAERTGKWLDGFLQGLAQASRRFGIVLAGGDTSRFSKIALSLTVTGEVSAGHALRRSGAKPGDLIFVSGTLGAAHLGLEMLLRKGSRSRARPKPWQDLVMAHLRPAIQLDLGLWLSGEFPRRERIASAAIDTSDGLSTDLGHLCEASGVGARIWASKLPIVRIPRGFNWLRLEPLHLALNGGEDYQLLFTVPRGSAAKISQWKGRAKLTQIGEIKRGPHVELIRENGRIEHLRPRGWDSFRR